MGYMYRPKLETEMTTISIDENRIKELFKQAMVELFEERKDLFYDLFAEVIEESALVNAIREGEATDYVNKEEVFQILEGLS